MKAPGYAGEFLEASLFRTLLLRGIAWTTKEPVDRFNELVLPGAHVGQTSEAGQPQH